MVKKLFSAQKLSKGFTLIELLVVIGILGVLAAALVATLDPFEQLKKAQDTNLKNESVELLSGLTRYYSTHTAMPWAAATAGGAGCNGTTAPSNTVANGSFASCLTALISDGELKSGFSTQSNLNSVVVTNTAAATSGPDTIVCFKPSSKAMSKDPNTAFTATGGACTPSSTTACYWCAR